MISQFSTGYSRKLGIPATTIQRRRKRLEKDFLKISYALDLSKFGWHKVDFLIATENGKTDTITKSLLKRDEVVYVGKSIGQHTIDLRVETILKDNAEILRMMELLKATPSIKDVVWTEIVQVVGCETSTSTNHRQDLTICRSWTDKQTFNQKQQIITIEPFELIFQFF